MKWAKHKAGFTIVELLIVVVVIAILAAITIVAFNGIQKRAADSALRSEIAQAVKKLETQKIGSPTELYPADQNASGLQASSGTTLTYFYNASNNSYCVQVVKSSDSYFATNVQTNPSSGTCTTNGLIGWWPLNGDTNDQSGSGNAGTANSTSLEVGQNTQPNNSYGFNGSSSHISVPSTSSLSVDVQTFSFWVYPNSWTTPTASSLLAKRSSSTQGWFIAYLVASNSLIFDCGSSTGRWTPNYAPPVNQWTHIMFTCTTTNGLALYVNGALNSSRPTVDRTAINAATELRFGRDPAGAQLLFFNGRLDDIRLYNRELSAGDAASLYASGAF